MHIALYARAWPFGYIPNGIVTYVHCMRAALLAEGHRVSLFAELLGPGEHGPDVYPVTRDVRRRLLDRLGRLTGTGGDGVFSWGVAIADAMERVHRRTPIDIVEIEEAFGWCADVQRRLDDVPVAVKLHGPAFLTEIGQAAQLPLTVARVASEGRALATATAVLSPSRCTLDAVQRHYGRLPGLLEHVPNPLLVAQDVPLWRRDGCERRTILFVGKFDWIKGGDVMLRAFARLLDNYPEAQLVFVGPDDGVTNETGSRTHLAAYAQAVLGARATAVRFLGRLDADRIPALRVQAAMTVVASRWENQCYTALEAMAQGCPTVAPDTGGMTEIIDDGMTGLLCRVEDPEDMCRAMCTLFDDPALGERLGRQAREHVLATHAPASLARRATSVYERVIAAHAQRRQPA